MKDYLFLYNGCCLYEVTVLAYFLSYSGREMCVCSPDGKPVKTQEGFSVSAQIAVADADLSDAASVIVPGGKIDELDSPAARSFLRKARSNGAFIAAICAGVDLLERAELLKDINSTHSATTDLMLDGNVLTARANAYVDFAIEFAKAQSLFRDEADLAETLSFWKKRRNIQPQ